ELISSGFLSACRPSPGTGQLDNLEGPPENHPARRLVGIPVDNRQLTPSNIPVNPHSLPATSMKERKEEKKEKENWLALVTLGCLTKNSRELASGEWSVTVAVGLSYFYPDSRQE